jgi:hypothetical protein
MTSKVERPLPDPRLFSSSFEPACDPIEIGVEPQF